MSSDPFKKATVKSVLSGDTVTLQSTVTVDGEPAPYEKQFSLAYVSAPRLKREGDEPYAFQSREYVRSNLLNHLVRFKTSYTIPTTSREYGLIVLNDGSNLTERLLEEGLVRVREEAGRKDDADDVAELIERYKQIEQVAKSEGKGLFGGEGGVIKCDNDFPADAQAFLESWKGKRLEAIVERVLTGDRIVVRLMLTPTLHQHSVILLAGVRAPSTARNEQPAEEYGNEAKAYAESRLGQQKIGVELVGTTPQNLLIGKVYIGKASFAESLLTEGLARVNDQHITLVGTDISKLRQAEGQAKNKRLKVWKNFVAKQAVSGVEAVVTRIWNGDTISVRNKAGAEKKLSLSSIKAPKVVGDKKDPFANEAKEYLRKRLIGKPVTVKIDGVRPANDGFPEKEVATIIREGKNIALALVENGFATVIRHRRDDNDRSGDYDELLQAEEEAKAAQRGLHNPKAEKTTDYIEASENLIKAKTYLSFLQRQKRIQAVVDFVASGGRFKLIIPKENIRITFLLGGIKTPRTARNEKEKSEPFGDEAAELAHRRLMQRDVEIDLEGVDKVGGFIGTLYVNGRENFARILLEEGLATVHAYSAEKSSHASELFAAEERAKAARKNIWANYVEDSEAQEAEEAEEAAAAVPTKRATDYRNIEVVQVGPDGRLKLQINHPDYLGKLERLQTSLRQRLRDSPSALTSLPKRGEVLAARFSEDKQLYRAKVTSVDRATQKAQVLYIDYGNVETLPITSLFPLPSEFSTSALRSQALDAVLSYIQFPAQEDYLRDALYELDRRVTGKQMVANVDYEDKKDGVLYVSVYEKGAGKEDSVNAELVEEGFVLVARKLRRWEAGEGGKEAVAGLRKREEKAREERWGVWEYGDLTGDD